MIEAGREISSGKNIVTNGLNIKDAHDDTKGFITETSKFVSNTMFGGSNSTKDVAKGIAPSDATKVNITPKIIKTPQKK
jgi:hypothetical protein